MHSGNIPGGDLRRDQSPESSISSSSGSSGDGDGASSSSYDSDSSSGDSDSSPIQQQTTTPASAESVSRVQLNPALRFERADNEYIPLPPIQGGHQVALTLRTLVKDRARYPECRHRRLDYLRAALEMFVAQVRLEVTQQRQAAQRHGRQQMRFAWKNKGELAVCFACCCDMLKLLYDMLQPGPLKPSWDSFVPQMTLLMMSESRVPAAILSEQTYRTKYLDWQKGGTRYGGEQSAANVRFPSAHERKVKIETYLRSGAGYKIEAVTVDPQTAAAQRTQRAVPVAAVAPIATPSLPVPPGVRLEIKSAAPPLSPAVAHIRGLEPSRATAVAGNSKPGAGSTPSSSGAPTSTKQLPEEMRHLYWLSALARVKGGDPIAAMPDDRASAMPGLVRLCDITDTIEEMLLLLDILLASSETVQDLFERLGGLLSIRRFVSQCVRSKDGQGLMQIVERLLRLRSTPWSAASQKAWRTNMDAKLTPDMGWLRNLTCVPAEKRAAWGAVLLIMEQKFIFRPPRDVAMAHLKRQREESSSSVNTATRTSAFDNIDISHWREPRVHTFDACRLPTALRAPPLCSTLEQDTIAFLNSKKEFTQVAQQVWRRSLLAVLNRHHGAVAADKIPLWYDAYQLLGIDSAAAGNTT